MMPKPVENKLEFEYKLTGTGWASCRYAINNKSSLVTASYLSNALGEFANAVQHISDGGEQVKCSFDEEPGEYRWIFQRQVNHRVQITLLSFNELWGNKPDSEGQVLVDELCDLHELDIATKNMLERVLLENGIEGYKEKWCEHDFPMKNYLWFCNKLSTPPVEVVEKLKEEND
jgi:hypothetical protein